jgi:hypothetical protein
MERLPHSLAGESLTRSSVAATAATMALALAAHLLLRWWVSRRPGSTDAIAFASMEVEPPAPEVVGGEET